MKSRNLPILTIALLAILAAIHALAPDRSLLWFGPAEISRGQYWRLLTGHLAHADLDHLLWNALGLAVLAWLIERRSRSLLMASLAAGAMTVNGLLLTPVAGLDYYCGLSGVLNSLLVIALWLEWRDSRSPWVAAVAIACVLKVFVEIGLGESVITRISWPPYAWSHLAGMVGGLVILLARKSRAFR